MFRLYIASLVVLITTCHAQEEGALGLPEDMACAKGPNAVTWQSVKQRFRTLLEQHSTPFKQAPREKIEGALKDAVADVQAVKGFDKQATDECGFGKLFIQLLSIATMDDPASIAQFLQETPMLSSPILTLLLDIPWVSTALSGWPFFGILAQVAMHKVDVMKDVLNNDAVDGLVDDVGRNFFTEVYDASQKTDLGQMYQASHAYLQQPHNANVLGQMTALATETVLQTDVKQRMKNVQWLQEQMRKVISTPPELDLALTSRWPLWGALHMSVDAFSTA